MHEDCGMSEESYMAFGENPKIGASISIGVERSGSLRTICFG